jgi:hypothetical protein
MLTGTALVESGGLYYNRQHGYECGGEGGAFGLFQVQSNSLATIRNYLYRESKQDLRVRIAKWLYQNEKADPFWFAKLSNEQILNISVGWHRLSCLLCRLHYLMIPEGIPGKPESQAKYWKKWYNTRYGDGTVEKFMEHWSRYEHNS